MILDVEFLYHLLYLLICALGLFVHEFFYSLLVSRGLAQGGWAGSPVCGVCGAHGKPPGVQAGCREPGDRGHTARRQMRSSTFPGRRCLGQDMCAFAFLYFLRSAGACQGGCL